MEHETLTQAIIGCAMKVHRTLGPGFLESVYQKALAYELSKAGYLVVCEYLLKVYYEDIPVGEFSADMLVENKVIVENKASRCLVPANEVQLVNYLTALRIDVGLLLNFGAETLQFKRKSRLYHPSAIADHNPVNLVNPV